MWKHEQQSLKLTSMKKDSKKRTRETHSSQWKTQWCSSDAPLQPLSAHCFGSRHCAVKFWGSWCGPLGDGILFQAQNQCLSFDPLWKSILALTDQAAITSSPAGRTVQFVVLHAVSGPVRGNSRVWVSDKKRSGSYSSHSHILDETRLQNHTAMPWKGLDLFVCSVLYPNVLCLNF